MRSLEVLIEHQLVMDRHILSDRQTVYTGRPWHIPRKHIASHGIKQEFFRRAYSVKVNEQYYWDVLLSRQILDAIIHVANFVFQRDSVLYRLIVRAKHSNCC